MLMSLIEVALFLGAIVLAVSGPQKSKKKSNKINPDAYILSEYYVTENGSLEHIKDKPSIYNPQPYHRDRTSK